MDFDLESKVFFYNWKMKNFWKKFGLFIFAFFVCCCFREVPNEMRSGGQLKWIPKVHSPGWKKPRYRSQRRQRRQHRQRRWRLSQKLFRSEKPPPIVASSSSCPSHRSRRRTPGVFRCGDTGPKLSVPVPDCSVVGFNGTENWDPGRFPGPSFEAAKQVSPKSAFALVEFFKKKLQRRFESKSFFL